MKKTVAVIFGGESVEHDISIITGVQTLNIIDDDKYEIIPMYLKSNTFYYGKALKNLESFIDFKPSLHKKGILKNGKLYRNILSLSFPVKSIDCALLCTHGGDGENGVLQGYLAYNGIAYTSPDVFQCSLFMDKAHTKKIIESFGIETLSCKVIYKEDFEKERENIISSIFKNYSYPLMVKPCSLGSSIGISKVKCHLELLEALEVAFCYDNKVLIETALENFNEINMALFKTDEGKIVFGELEEPIFGNGYLTFKDKYMAGGKGLTETKRIMPAKVKKEIQETIEDYSQKVYNNLDCKGIIRIDYLVKDDVVYLNEVNAIPGSLAFYLFKGKGISHRELIDMLISATLKLDLKRDCIIKKFNSSVLENLQNGSKTYNK